MAVYVSFIFWLSSAPRRIPGTEIFPWIDKAAHTLEYALLGLLLSRACRRSFPRMSRHRLQLIPFIFALSIGSADEFYQRFVPTRISSIWDTFWDCVGSLLGQRLYQRKLQRTP